MRMFVTTLKVCLQIFFPAQETIDYIQQRIYVGVEIKPFNKKSIFKKLLLKLTKECLFWGDNKLIKQTYGCPVPR